MGELDRSIYVTGEYAAHTGGNWFFHDSPFKAGQVMKMLRKHDLSFTSVCEIGCGAGGILAALSEEMDDSVKFVGYDISPQALEICRKKWNKQNLSFVLGDAFESDDRFELALVMDVIEHVEDCFGFLERARAKADYKVYHIPLEISCYNALMDVYPSRWKAGHIHYFSYASALAILRHTGHEVIDHFYTPTAFARPKQSLASKLRNNVRRMFPVRLSARLFSGQALLCLAR